MKKKIDVLIADRQIDVWNMNIWEKCSFDEAGINDEDEYEIETYLRDEYQERGYDDIEINFVIDIKQLKQELNLNNEDIAGFFGLTKMAYANSSAKSRYEAALCSFYAFVKSKREEEKENKTGEPDNAD